MANLLSDVTVLVSFQLVQKALWHIVKNVCINNFQLHNRLWKKKNLTWKVPTLHFL